MIVNTIHAVKGTKHSPSNIHTAIAAISKLVPYPIRICSDSIVANNGIVKSKLRTEMIISDMIPKTQFLLFIQLYNNKKAVRYCSLQSGVTAFSLPVYFIATKS